MSSLHVWLIISVGAYMLLMLLIGFLASRKISDTRDYIVAGGKMGWALSIGTIFATWFGAETCMGSSMTAYEKGILGVIADPFGAGLCLIIAGVFFAGFFYKLGIRTIVDFFEMRYGRNAAKVFSLVYIPVYLGWVGAQLLAFGTILNSLAGLAPVPAILVSTAVVIIYTYAGGMWADAITDLFQMVIILAGLCILFPVLVSDLGGLASLKARIPAEFFRFTPSGNSPLTWLNYAQAWMIVGLGSLPAQDLFQRLMSPKNARIARWGAVLSGVLYMAIGLLPVLLGIFSRVALPGYTGSSVLIDLILKYLPAPLIALMVGALLSAIMSSADSALLAPAGIIGNNILTYIKPDADEKLKLAWCRRGILIIGILSLVMALYFKNIYQLCINAWGVLLVGVAAPMIAGVFWKRATAAAALSGMGAGTVSWILFSVFLPEGYPAHLLGFAASAATIAVVTLATKPQPSEDFPPLPLIAEPE